MKYFAGIDLYFLENKKNLNVLDYGCGNGDFTIFFIKKGFNVTAVDIDPKSESKINLLLSDEEKSRFKFVLLKQEDNFANYTQMFDFIICREVLEHIKNYKNILCIFKKILKDSGLCVISIPTFFTEKYFTFWDKNWPQKCEHVNVFKKKDIFSLAKKNNFEIEKITRHSFRRTIFWSLVTPFRINHEMGKILNRNKFINFAEYFSNVFCNFKFIDKLGNRIAPKSRVFYLRQKQI